MRIWLRNRRSERHLTQEEVSKLSSISRTHYTSIETGVRTPSVFVAKKIAKTLRFNWTDFYNDGLFKKQKGVD